MILRIKRSIIYRWKKFFNKPKLEFVKIAPEAIQSLPYKPLISIIVPVYNIERKLFLLLKDWKEKTRESI